jgi:hypothetical protein
MIVAISHFQGYYKVPRHWRGLLYVVGLQAATRQVLLCSKIVNFVNNIKITQQVSQ